MLCKRQSIARSMVSQEEKAAIRGRMGVIMEKIHFAVIGTSKIADQFMQASSLAPEAEVKAVYSRAKERGQAFAKKHGIKKVYTDLDELAEDRDIDAVYIASPTVCHSKQAMIMIKEKKHVLCEKPMVSNSHEMEALLHLAEEKQVILLEAIRHVYTPGYQAVKEFLPQIGQLRRALFIYCQYSSRYDKFKAGIVENAFRPELSNGAVMDIGVYGVHMLVSLFGYPFGVKANGLILPGSIDGSGSIIAKYKDMQAEIIYSKIADSFLPSEIQGEEGCIIMDQIASPTRVKLIRRNGDVETAEPEILEPDMYYEIDAFCKMISGRMDHKPYNEFSILTMRMMDDARKQMDIVFPADF